jgi:HK97 family phage major capsid protein
LWQAITDMYPVFVSNAIPNNLTKGTGVGLSAMFFGNWSDLIMAFWSGMDVIVDPYTGSTSGTLRIVVLQDVDINVRHPESFSVCKDIATT